MVPFFTSLVFDVPASQTAGGDINFAISFTKKTNKGGKKKKKHVTILPETRVDSYCDEHVQSDAFAGAIDMQKALASALTSFYAASKIERDPESIEKASKIFVKRQVRDLFTPMRLRSANSSNKYTRVPLCRKKC